MPPLEVINCWAVSIKRKGVNRGSFLARSTQAGPSLFYKRAAALAHIKELTKHGIGRRGMKAVRVTVVVNAATKAGATE